MKEEASRSRKRLNVSGVARGKLGAELRQQAPLAAGPAKERPCGSRTRRTLRQMILFSHADPIVLSPLPRASSLARPAGRRKRAADLADMQQPYGGL